MNLRDHPLLCHRGIQSWPPAWHCLGDGKDRHPKGEVGILKEVKVPATCPLNRCFLVMEYRGTLYMGCVLSEDTSFSIALGRFLSNYCNESIERIGDLDVSHML